LNQGLVGAVKVRFWKREVGRGWDDRAVASFALPDMISIEGAVVTDDAVGFQRDIASNAGRERQRRRKRPSVETVVAARLNGIHQVLGLRGR
jgi:hypothetical protein